MFTMCKEMCHNKLKRRNTNYFVPQAGEKTRDIFQSGLFFKSLRTRDISSGGFCLYIKTKKKVRSVFLLPPHQPPLLLSNNDDF